MKVDNITYKANPLEYSISGNGKNALFAFHGFGQGSKYFNSFVEKLGDLYTVYSFDLFFHGKSDWKSKIDPLTKEDWKHILEVLLKKHHIDKFALCGYSMGGKFAMASMEVYPDKVNQMILIAPDGIKTLFWYSLATYPSYFRKYFRAMIVKPRYFYKLVKWAKKLKLVDKSMLKFANSQMNTREQRRRVYLTWVTFRLLSFDLQEIAEILNKNKIPVYMVTGKYDKIITAKNMLRLLKHINKYEKIILESGHTSLIKNTAAYLNNNRSILKFNNESIKH